MQENPGPQVPYGTQPQGPPAYPYPPVQQQRPWFLPVPRGVGYDRLARTPEGAAVGGGVVGGSGVGGGAGGGELWRQIVGTLIVAAAFLVIGLVVLLLGSVVALLAGMPQPLPGQLFGDPVFGLVVLLLSIACVLPVVFGTAALVQRRRPGTLSSVAGRLRWSWLLRCLLLAVVALVLGQVAQAVALAVTGEQVSEMFGWAGWSAFLPAIIVIVLLVPFQAATEEYIFRGWILQAFGAHLRNPVWGIVLGSLVFASLHGYTWVGLVDVFSFGVVTGFLAVRTGGLESGIALHTINNTLAFGISAAAGQLNDALQQGEVPWQSLAGSVVQLAVFVIGVLHLTKKRAISTISP